MKMKNIGDLELNMIYTMDCVEGMKLLPDNSIDSIVTDPPYGLETVSVAWDSFQTPKGGARVATEWKDFGSKEHARDATEVARISRKKNIAYYNSMLMWLSEAHRILKPGGHLLAFSSARTYHRLACAVEDSNFEIRDQIQWLYATGFPKSKSLLKPAFEPIVLARKAPSEKSVKLNIEKHGTGNINIDGCRIGEQEKYPTNIIFDENVGESLDSANKNMTSFFYTPKPSKKEKGDFNNHPTVKPIALMEYLIKLVTPAEGVLLDPFCGSGTTLLASKANSMNFIGFEMDASYVDIANRRLDNREKFVRLDSQ